MTMNIARRRSTRTRKTVKRIVTTPEDAERKRKPKRTKQVKVKNPPLVPKTIKKRDLKTITRRTLKSYMQAPANISYVITDPKDNVPRQMAFIIDSVDRIDNRTTNQIKQHTNKETRDNQLTMIKEALNLKTNEDAEGLITTHPLNPFREPKPSALGHRINDAFTKLKSTLGSNVTLEMKNATINLQRMFAQEEGMYILVLKVKHHKNEKAIQTPTNPAGIYLQIAVYHCTERIFIPGNNQGYAFQIKNKATEVKNIIRQLNERPAFKAGTTIGLYPIIDNTELVRPATIAAMYEIRQDEELSDEPTNSLERINRLRGPTRTTNEAGMPPPPARTTNDAGKGMSPQDLFNKDPFNKVTP